MGPLDAFVARADGALVVVTAASPDGLFGCLVGFHTQVSIEPLRYAVCLSHRNATFAAASTADALGVHLLGADQIELASLFGEWSADDGVAKFDRCTWRRVGDGPPVVEPALAWFVGGILEAVPMGDHTAFVLDPLRHGGSGDGEPLRYAAAAAFEAGH